MRLLLRLADDAPLPSNRRQTLTLYLGGTLAATGYAQLQGPDLWGVAFRHGTEWCSPLATAVLELCRQGSAAAADASADVGVQQLSLSPVLDKDPGSIAATVVGFTLNKEQVDVSAASMSPAAM